MGNDRALAPRPSHTTDDLTLSGLLDVLDRADPLPARAGHRPGRAAVHRTSTARPRAAARPVPVPARRARPVILAPAPAAVPAWTAPAPAPALRPGLRTRLRGLVRRLAMWGAGPDGAHLAWGRPARSTPAAARRPDGPVLLTELPSTPTIPPAAPSPAAALRPPRPPQPIGASRVPVVAPLARHVPAPRPAPAPRTAQGSRSPGGARASAPARSRGDPRPPPARGQPPG